MRKGVLEPVALGDVADAPHSSGDSSVDDLWDATALVDPPIVQFDGVFRAALRMPDDVVEAAHERIRDLQLGQDRRQQLIALNRGRQALR